MFLNFPLHTDLQAVSGVDVSWFDSSLRKKLPPALTKGPIHLRWMRNWMGCKPSPFVAVRYYYLAEEFARGCPSDVDNQLRWDEILLNLPGAPNYDPSKPDVMKWDAVWLRVPGDIIAFVDDLRASGFSAEHAWQVARQVAARLQFLGIQDAARKRRPPVKEPGAWAGAMLSTTSDGVYKTVSQAKWEKAKAQLDELRPFMDSRRSKAMPLSYKRLEQIRGFLCHLGMTFDIIMPYLKGFHLALAYHMGERDEEGWKIKKRKRGKEVVCEPRKTQNFDEDWEEVVDDSVVTHQFQKYGAFSCTVRETPKWAIVLPQLKRDVRALLQLFEEDAPPKCLIRSKKVYSLFYGFADASGTGFGSTIMGPQGIRYRMGTWSEDTRSESSNYREFRNVVEALELEFAEGRLTNSTIFLCTDNSTVENALYKGNSSSKLLYDLVLRMRKLEMKAGTRVIVSHVSGERMKAQGTDGVSRGVFTEGIANGSSMLEYIPFHLSAIDRSPKLEEWIRSWAGSDLITLQPRDWFERGHDIHGWTEWSNGFKIPKTKSGVYLWCLPPACADVALEALRKARIKRQESMHVVVVPKLLSTRWRKLLFKAADLIFDVAVGDFACPRDMHEELTCAILFPYLPFSPWEFKGSPKMYQLERDLRRVCKESHLVARDILCEFLHRAKQFPTMSPDVVWGLLHFQKRTEVSHTPVGQGGRPRRRPRRT